MREYAVTLRRTLWLACACVLLLPRMAVAGGSAGSLLAIDVDGDGRRDHVTLEPGDRSVLRVWLSASGTTQEIQTRAALLQVIATDLDGDHRPELIARDSNLKIHVWTRKHNRFHAYRPRYAIPASLKPANHRQVEDDDDESQSAIASTAFAPPAMMPCSLRHAPLLETLEANLRQTTSALRSPNSDDPFSPRPPPSAIR